MTDALRPTSKGATYIHKGKNKKKRTQTDAREVRARDLVKMTYIDDGEGKNLIKIEK